MPNLKNDNRKTSTGDNKQNSNNKRKGISSGQMPHVPTAREKAKDIDSSRRGNAQTFEL